MHKYRRFKISKSTMTILLITLGMLAIAGTSMAGKVEYDVTLYLEDDFGSVVEPNPIGTSSWPGLGVELRFSDNPTVKVDGIDMELHGLYITRKAGKIIAVSLFLNSVESGELYRTRKVELDEEAQITPVKGEIIELIINKEASVYKKSKGKGGHSGETPMGEISIGTAIYKPQ